MNWFSYLDKTGYLLIKDLPDECVQDCSHQGPCDEDVEYWVKELDFDAPETPLKEYLTSFRAWDQEELEDHEANLERMLWSICNDIKEERK